MFLGGDDAMPCDTLWTIFSHSNRDDQLLRNYQGLFQLSLFKRSLNIQYNFYN